MKSVASTNAPLSYSPFAALSNGNASPTAEMFTCASSNPSQAPGSPRSFFGSLSRTGAVKASLRRLGSAFGLSKSLRKIKNQQSDAHIIAHSVHGGCQHRNAADVAAPSTLRHTASAFELTQTPQTPNTSSHGGGGGGGGGGGNTSATASRLADPGIAAAPGSIPVAASSSLSSPSAAASSFRPTSPASVPPTPGIRPRHDLMTGSPVPEDGRPRAAAPAERALTQSAPLRSLQASCTAGELTQRLVRCGGGDDDNGATAAVVNKVGLGSSLSAPSDWPQLQRACAAVAAAMCLGSPVAEAKPAGAAGAGAGAAAAASAAAEAGCGQVQALATINAVGPLKGDPSCGRQAADVAARGGAAAIPVGPSNSGPHSRGQLQEPQDCPLQPQQQAPQRAPHQRQAQQAQQLQAPQSEEPTRGRSGSMLLGMARSLPPGMQRFDWSIDDYLVTRRLFKGDRTAVYKATCKRSGVPVALKVYLLPRIPVNTLHQIAREIQIQLGLSHRSVLSLYGAFQDPRRLVLVMELATRGDLFNLKSAMDRPLTEDQLQQMILEPLLDALSYLHGKGVCHRDIKPENLLFTSDWGLRLADFGVSINLLEERAVTRAGTAYYMAPEVERCPLKTDPEDNKNNPSIAYTTAADVWSVGVLAYELLVGFPPVVKERGAAASGDGDRQRSGYRGGAAGAAGDALLSFPASVSPAARDFISSALAQLPEERPTVRQLRCHPWMLAAAAGWSTSPRH